MWVIKLGEDLYRRAGVDRNGGKQEFFLIDNELMDLRSDYFVVIVNGDATEKEELELLQALKGIRKIFIATDSFCFEKNARVIRECEYVLHQMNNWPFVYSGFREDTTKVVNMFSGVPYLFATERKKVNKQACGVIFGGANTGRQKEFSKYIFDSSGNVRSLMVPFCKEYDAEGKVLYDDRIGYDEFNELMRHYKYSLMITRDDYKRTGWITPRIIEAICAYSLPIADMWYVLPNEMRDAIPRVSSYEQLVSVVEYFEKNEKERLEILEWCQKEIKKKGDMFRNTVGRIIEGEL